LPTDIAMREESIAYQEALDYLYRFVDYSLVRNFRYSPEKFDLGRMVIFLEHLGNPHRQYPVIHVAGTKGKGSTAAMVASSLRAAGYKTGFYTSPHLQDFTERFQINGVPVSRADIIELVNLVRPYVDNQEGLTWFEITTAIAFLLFARQGVNAAVIEVGLGGRLDATNTVDPLVSVITSLSMDHVAVLGDTIEKIAFEKAGIIKLGRPVVLAPQRVEARQVVEQIAADRGSVVVEVGRDYFYEPLQSDGPRSLDGQSFRVWPAGRETEVQVLTIPLLGLHQVENAVTAYAALQVAREQGLSISDAAIESGFSSVVWPGRFEVLSREPLVIADSAHNRDSAHRLRQALEDYLPGVPVVLLFGASEDKDVEGMFAELMPYIREVVATQSVHPRALEAAKIVALAESHGRPGEAVLPVERAVQAALQRAAGGAAVVAAGSLFLAAAVREMMTAQSTLGDIK
jgi:dihydrofolate synthase / folylpolyglutamate synthase